MSQSKSSRHLIILISFFFTEKGNCYLGSQTCNCDHKKSKNQKDEGTFNDKDLLPVLSIHLGDTGSKKESGAVTLGKFECRG